MRTRNATLCQFTLSLLQPPGFTRLFSIIHPPSMADPFLGEIHMFGFNFAPRGYAFCNGQLMSISQNSALFSLLGTQFGGDGRTTFALPDLRSRVPMMPDSSQGGQQGMTLGQETVTLVSSELPTHSHALNASSEEATSGQPAPDQQGIFGNATLSVYGPASNLTPMSLEAVSSVGGTASHTNIQPVLAINFCIALSGKFPSRN